MDIFEIIAQYLIKLQEVEDFGKRHLVLFSNFITGAFLWVTNEKKKKHKIAPKTINKDFT